MHYGSGGEHLQFTLVGKSDLARSLRSGLGPDPIIHSTTNPLFAAEVPLSRLDRDMAQNELDLFQFCHLPRSKAARMFDVDRESQAFRYQLSAHTHEPRAILPFRSA